LEGPEEVVSHGICLPCFEKTLTEAGFPPPLDPVGQIREGAEHLEKALDLLQNVNDLEPRTQEARETVEGLKYSVQYLRDLWADMKDDVREVTAE